MSLRLALAESNLDQNDHNSNIEVRIMLTRMHEALILKTGRPLKALVLAGALSLLAASAAHAGGLSGGVVSDAKNASAATTSRKLSTAGDAEERRFRRRSWILAIQNRRCRDR